MDRLFEGLKGFFKRPPIIIDNFLFRLHYRVTFVIFVAFSIMVTSKQYFGDPIDCITKDDIPNNLLDTYCWIHTTFSIENAWQKRVGDEVPYPGVDKTTANEKRVYHAYYQWVCFVLFFQACSFYVPRYLWKMYEGGRVSTLVKNLNTPLGDDPKEIKLLVEYLQAYKDQFNKQFYFHTFTEILNFINVILQMCFIDKFLGGEFSSYGWNVISFTEWNWSARYDPMIKVFPRLTKCTFHRFGSSGDVQKHDAMCILPINILNEKIYIFLWFWLYLVAICSSVALLHRLIIIFFTQWRCYNTKLHCHVIDKNLLENFIDRISIGNWFMFDLLSRNMDQTNFKTLVEKYTNNPPQNKRSLNV